MHEWALAEAVASTALKAAGKEKLQEITKIKIKMGELQQIDPEIFESALKEVILPQKEVLKNAEVEIETEKAVFQCRACGHRWKFEEARKLLEAMGIPCIQAPSEGEAQASYIVKKGDAYAVGSQDFDCLLVGAPILVRNLTSAGKRKLPGKHAYVSVSPEQIRLEENLKTLGVTREQLVDMAILIGTDFNEGIKGIGPKKSLELIKKNGSIENILPKLGEENHLTLEEIEAVRKIFLNPDVTDEYTLKWYNIDEERVIEILCEEHQFSRDRVDSILKKFSKASKMMKQRTLF